MIKRRALDMLMSVVFPSIDKLPYNRALPPMSSASQYDGKTWRTDGGGRSEAYHVEVFEHAVATCGPILTLFSLSAKRYHPKKFNASEPFA